MIASQKNIYIMAIISFVLLIGSLSWLHYLTMNNYIIEQFQNTSAATNYNVNIPINTSYTCDNMCGPNNRCSKTGGQCFSDMDCYGCKAYSNESSSNKKLKEVPGINDAGKLTTAISPTFSKLTTDIGTQATKINKEPGYIKSNDDTQNPPQYFKGVNTWKDSYDVGTKLYDKRYNPGMQVYTPKYPERKSLSGEFMYDGPPAANEYF